MARVLVLLLVSSPALTGSEKSVLPPLQSAASSRGLPEQFFVSEFHFSGNTVFSDAELATLVKGFTGRSITMIELDQARTSLTRHYIQNGFVSSGAVIRDQSADDGIIEITLIEGRVSRIRFHGNRYSSDRFYSDRLRGRGTDPVNTDAIQEQLQLWRLLYPVESTSAELSPGERRGEAELDVTVNERMPHNVGVRVRNSRPVSSGSEQLDVLLQSENLFGYGDDFDLMYGMIRRNAGKVDALGLDEWSLGYELPINPRGTSVGARATQSNASVLEEPFVDLDISSEWQAYSIQLTHPLKRTLNEEFSLSLTGEWKESRTFLLGQPYSFSEGPIDGEAVVSVARLAGQYINRSPLHSLAARVSISLGLDALGATVSHFNRDAKFAAFLGQVQYVRRLFNTGNQFVIRVAGQYTPDELLSLEQLPIGGAATVRGYRENSLVRDTGILSTIEFRIPLLGRKDGGAMLQLTPFYDFGAGWNNGRQPPGLNDLHSVGIGLLYNPNKLIDFSLMWGHAINELEVEGDNIQDAGVHFRLTLWAF